MAWRSILSFGSLLGLALAAALWFVAPEDQILALSQEAWIAVAAGSLLVCAGMFPAVAGGCSLPSARLDRIGLAGLAGWGILALVSALQAGRFSSGSASGATAVSCAVLGVWVALGGAQGRHLVAWIGVAPVSGMAVALWRWAGAFLPRVLEEGGIWREAYASASFDLNSFPLPSKNLAGLAGAMALAFCAGVWDRRAPRSARRGILLLGAAGGLAVAASGGEAAAVGLGAGLLGAFARRLGARRSLALGAVAALALGSWGFASGLMDRHAFRVRTLARAGRVTLGAPWLGHGPGSFFGAFDSPDPSGGAPGEVYALEGSSTRVTHAHSLPLQIAVEAGWPCALALGVAVAVALLSVRRDSGPEARVRDGVRGALAAWAVASLFGAEGSLPIALLWGSCGTGFLCSGGRAGGATAVPGSLRAPLPASARVLLVLAGSALAWEGGIRPASALRASAPRALVLRGGDFLTSARGAVALPDPVAEQAALMQSHAELGARPARAVRRLVERRRACPTGSVCYWEAQYRMACGDVPRARAAFRRCAGWYGARPDLYDVAFSWRVMAPERPDAPPSTPRDLWGWLDACRDDPAWREDLLPRLREGMRLAPDDARLIWLEARILSAVDPAAARAADERAGDLAARLLARSADHRPSLWTRAALLRASDPAAAARMLERLCRRFPSDWSFVRLRGEALAAAGRPPR